METSWSFYGISESQTEGLESNPVYFVEYV